jgi:transposase InsO family protein
VERPDQVWCPDITYLPMQKGFLCLVAIMDRSSRKVLAWRISNTLGSDFCVEALNEVIHRFGPPEIMNMEHGRGIGSSGHATSGVAVHVLRPDRPAQTGRHPDFDGRQGALPRQSSGIPSERWQQCP